MYTCMHIRTHSRPQSYIHTCMHSHTDSHTHDTHTLDLTRIFLCPFPYGPPPTEGIHLALRWQPQSFAPSGNTSGEAPCQAGGEDSQGQRQGGEKTRQLPGSSRRGLFTPLKSRSPGIGPRSPPRLPGQLAAPPTFCVLLTHRSCAILPPAPTLVTSKHSHTKSNFSSNCPWLWLCGF